MIPLFIRYFTRLMLLNFNYLDYFNFNYLNYQIVFQIGTRLWPPQGWPAGIGLGDVFIPMLLTRKPRQRDIGWLPQSHMSGDW